MYYWHALPEGWEEMSYEAFLQERRERMAKVVEEAYQVLAGDEQQAEEALSVAELVALDEGNVVEFKSTFLLDIPWFGWFDCLTGMDVKSLCISQTVQLADNVTIGCGDCRNGSPDISPI